MKFRAKITDSPYILHFNHAINMVSKLSKQCTVRINANGLFIIAFEETGERQPMVWLNIPQKEYFSDFNLVGVTKEHNEICLRLNPQMIVKVLSSIKGTQVYSKTLKLSLTKRKVPCLTCEVFGSEPENCRMCLHDIPVEVISRKDWADIVAPIFSSNPDVSITLPDVENLEFVWDKLKSLSRHIVVLGNSQGSLSLRVETDVSDVTSHFKDLPVSSSSEYEGLNNFVKGRVVCSKFMVLRDLYQGNPVKTILHIKHRRYLLFDIMYEHMTLHYIIPAVLK